MSQLWYTLTRWWYGPMCRRCGDVLTPGLPFCIECVITSFTNYGRAVERAARLRRRG